MAGAFKDFIPAGDDTGAQGSGFKDFVPAPKPVKQELPPEEVKEETPVVEVEKTNAELRAEAEALGIDTKKLTNKKMLVDAIAAAKGV